MFPGGGGGSEYFVRSHHQQQQLFSALDGIGVDAAGTGAFTAGVGGGDEVAAVSETHCHALLYNLSVLKDKVQQLEPVVGVAVGHDGHGHGHGAVASVSVAGAGAIIQEIITAASSMMYAFQQLYCVGVGVGLGAASTSVNNNNNAAAQEDGVVVVVGHVKNGATTADDDGHGAAGCSSSDQQAMDHAMQQWQHLNHGGHGHGHSSYYIHSNSTNAAASSSQPTTTTTDTIIELDAAELLARYTHYCQVCGKGFKRDANLRMHMRAHGDEYKSKAALANPTKSSAAAGEAAAPAPPEAAGAAPARSKYSCPQEGCRWNRKHAKFQPLKSVICVKNHYKRSHCPKMYLCNRCNRKHFSVLSDLRTHEKHCGDHRWLCSCGTNFSRKDKLAGHVSLFAGHEPAVPLGAAAAGGRHEKRSTTSSQLGNCAATGFGMS